MTPKSNQPGAVVVDANIALSIAANEPSQPMISGEIEAYSQRGFEFFSPGVLVTETLYVLCGKLNDGTLSSSDHALAIKKLDLFLKNVSHSPGGDAKLLLRAEAIRGNYTCRRSADGIYIALAEELALVRPTVLLTLDADMYRQAGKNARSVDVRLLTI